MRTFVLPKPQLRRTKVPILSGFPSITPSTYHVIKIARQHYLIKFINFVSCVLKQCVADKKKNGDPSRFYNQKRQNRLYRSLWQIAEET